MKDRLSVPLICLSWLFFGMFSPSNCVDPVHCQWGSYGDWSECDGCTKTQSRTRAMVVYAQFGGSPCSGGATQTQPCETARGCPLKEGCGGRFRCRSGKCISQSMVCNGDQDCEEDNQDELKCGPDKTFPVCNNDKPPPNVEQLGLGFDSVTGKQRGSVINTKSYGGQCRTVFSGDNKVLYRLPQSTLRYNFEVKIQNDFSDEFYTSSWSYAKDVVKRETTTGTTTGFNNYDLHQTEKKNRNNHLLVVKNNVEVAQFQNHASGYLSLSEEFWKVLATLPTVYDYATYRMVVERFGTHYLSEGTLGGYFQALLSIDQETATQMGETIECNSLNTSTLLVYTAWSNGPSGWKMRLVDVEGGATAHIAALKALDLSTPGRNWDMYKNWAESVRTFPAVIKRKMRPLYELVKEVQCAGMKRLHLKRAIEQYLNERHPCRCQPCRNNGLVVMAGDKCSCICKPGTDGLACENGKEVEGQEGVIHGSWSCWSGWTSCSGGQRSRTRACSNPAPQRGGHHCNGEVRETTGCDDDQDLQYLQTMEPQCFDLTVPPKETCRSPPPLPNGYVLVGIDGQITTKLSVSFSPAAGEIQGSRCHVPSLLNDVTGSPWQPTYDIGERIPLSCPEGRHIVGDKEIICDSSLHWSPDPNTITCSQAPKTLDHLDGPAGQCKPWEKLAKDKCICKMPYECTSSLQVCANNLENGRTNRLSVCKMHTLNCLGRSFNLSEDSACEWPTNTTSPCTDCQLWETCDGQTNRCRCKDWAECSDPGLSVCVRMGDDANSATQTLSECEAGLRRCKGEKVSVVSILPCSA
uniref:Complement component C7 n=1 Tax=Oncorhynchus tshawytscha TaxID=74940 RepID=A0A8C8ERH8_ONCTS